MTDKVNLSMHPDFPMLPAQAVNIKPDTGCANCSLKQTAGHRSCREFSMRNEPAVRDDNRISLKDIRSMQGKIHRKATDALGPFQSNWNAKRQINFRIDTYWKLISASGNTITLEPLDGDARMVLYSSWRERDPEFGFYWVNGFRSLTAVSPLDWVTFDDESIASRKITARVVRVESCSETEIVIEVDKDCSIASEAWPELDPEYIGVTVSHYGKEEEQWTFAEEPHFFFGSKVSQRVINLTYIPSDGVFVLETGVIAPPESFDPLDANFYLDGFKEGSWEAITDLTRLNIKSDLSTYSFGVTQPEGSVQPEPTVDLTEEYERFRVTYYRKTVITDNNCSIRGFDRCFHSGTDFSNSGYEATGVVSDTDKKRSCFQRIYTTFEYNDDDENGIPESVTPTEHHPTGLSNYPDDGACIQYGYCNQFANSVHNLSNQNAPFMIDYQISRILKELWHAVNFKSDQLAVGYSMYDIGRILHPSIAGLIGRYGGLTSPEGIHPATYFYEGGWSNVEPLVITDEDGNERLAFVPGFERGNDGDIDTVGILPANVDGFTAKRNVINASDDSYEDNLLTLVAGAVERDSGELKGYSIANASHTIALSDILMPNIDLNSTSTQHNSGGSVLVDGDIHIRIYPLRQVLKSEINIGSRVVHSVTSLGDKRYKIEFANADKVFSIVNSGDPFEIGDSFDEIFTVQGSAVYPIMGYEWQTMVSFYDRHKYYGDRKYGAWRGDCIEIAGKRFMISDVRPSDGSEAIGWGERIESYELDLVKAAFLAIYSTGGTPYGDYAVEFTEVKDSTTFDVYEIITGKYPGILTSKQCWFDGFKGLYFSESDWGKSVDISYKNIDDNSNTESAIIPHYLTVTLDIDYSDYSSATASAFINSTAVAIITGGDPTTSQVKIEDNSGKVQVTYNIGSAPGKLKLKLEFAEEAPTPTDGWCIGNNFLTWGKKRDVIEVIDDSGYFDDETADGLYAVFYKSATVFKPKSAYQLQHTVQGVDDWQDVDSAEYTVEAARGKITIKSAFASTLDTAKKHCFRLVGVELFDHRGNVSADLYNVTMRAIDSLQWAMTSFTGGGDASFGYSQTWEYTVTHDPNPEIPCARVELPTEYKASGGAGLPGNVIAYSLSGGSSDWRRYLFVNVRSNGFGMPEILKHLPDGCEILEAKAVVYTQGVTYIKSWGSYRYYNCDVEVPEVSNSTSTITNASVSIIGFTDKDNYDVIGSVDVPQVGKRCVVDITDVLNAMYDARTTNQYKYGFGSLINPDSLFDIDGMKATMNGEPARVNLPYCPGSSCEGSGYTVPMFPDFVNINVTWDNVAFDAVAIKVKYPDGTIQMQRRLPAMGELG